MQTVGDVDAELLVPFHMQEASESRVKRDRVPFVPTPKQCLWWTRKNTPRQLHWPANTPTVRVKYGMKWKQMAAANKELS